MKVKRSDRRRRKLCSALVRMMYSYDLVIRATQPDELDENFEAVLEKFGACFDELTVVFNEYLPPAASLKNHDWRTPKVTTMTTMIEYLKTTRCGLRRLSDQPFEVIHHRYRCHAEERRMTRSGVLTLPKHRSEQMYEVKKRDKRRRLKQSVVDAENIPPQRNTPPKTPEALIAPREWSS